VFKAPPGLNFIDTLRTIEKCKEMIGKVMGLATGLVRSLDVLVSRVLVTMYNGEVGKFFVMVKN